VSRRNGRGGAFYQRLKPGRLGEVDPEAVTPPLIPAGHLGRSMAKLFLHIALVDLG